MLLLFSNYMRISSLQMELSSKWSQCLHPGRALQAINWGIQGLVGLPVNKGGHYGLSLPRVLHQIDWSFPADVFSIPAKSSVKFFNQYWSDANFHGILIGVLKKMYSAWFFWFFCWQKKLDDVFGIESRQSTIARAWNCPKTLLVTSQKSSRLFLGVCKSFGNGFIGLIFFWISEFCSS